MRETRFRSFLVFALLAAGVVSVSLLVASYVIFAPGTSLTCHATFAISETQRIRQTFQHMYPGHMGMVPFAGRLLYAAFIGLLVGVPSGLVLRTLGTTANLRKAALLGLGAACFLEYLLASLLILMLNSHQSESAGPFMSFEVPLIGFSVDAPVPFETGLNVASAILMHTLQPLGVTGLYVLLVVPLIGGVLVLLLAKKVARE